MHGRRALMLCALVPTAVGACTGLKSAEEAPLVAPPDASVDSSIASVGDAGTRDAETLPEPPDAGAPPDDFECGKSYWTLDDKPNKDCAARRVIVVSNEAAPDNKTLSIARTTTGRVGISYKLKISEDTTKLRVAYFPSNRPEEVGAPTIVTRDSASSMHAGALSRVVASAPDTLHVLSFDWDHATEKGPVTSQRLESGTPTFTPPETLVADVADPSQIAFAMGANAQAYALIRMKTTAEKAKLLVFSRTANESWSPIPDVPSLGYGLIPKEGPNIGAASMLIDVTGNLHVLYHHNETKLASNPRYHSLTGDGWSYRKTIDNNIPSGWCGFSPSLALFGSRKYALYYYNRVQLDDPTPTAELRLASWVGEDDKPTHELVDQGIPSGSTYEPRYAATMVIDKYGLLHIAMVVPSVTEAKGYLQYRRQQRTEGGGTRWLTDIIDDDVLSVLSGAVLDMVVDDNARPHIAYISGRDRLLRYATRYDR